MAGGRGSVNLATDKGPTHPTNCTNCTHLRLPCRALGAAVREVGPADARGHARAHHVVGEVGVGGEVNLREGREWGGGSSVRE